MKFFKKLAALLAAAVVAATALTAVTVTAGADSIYDTAKEITSGKENKVTGVGYSGCADYKVKVTKSGTLSLNITAGLECVYIYVYDSDGNQLSYEDYEMISGNMYSTNDQRLRVTWNKATEKIKLKASYPVTKGTYYIRVQRDDWYSKGGDCKISLTATFPSTAVKKAKISYLTLKVAEGDSVQLGAALTGSGSVSWSSSNSSVASVTAKGKVTAVNTGSAIITAKCGSSKQRIKIIVS